MSSAEITFTGVDGFVDGIVERIVTQVTDRLAERLFGPPQLALPDPQPAPPDIAPAAAEPEDPPAARPEEPEPEPVRRSTARSGRIALTPKQDTEIANRYGTGETVRSLAEAFCVSMPTIYNAIKRASVTLPPSDIPAKPFPAKVTPPPETGPTPSPAPRKPTPGVTARCTDCHRTWTLTGRQLQIAVDTHEFKRGHLVDITEGADT